MEQFVSGLHSRPFSAQLNPALTPYEFDYGGRATAHILALQTWPVTGPDMSKWQGDTNFATLAGKSQFVVLRYLYGNATVDSRLDQYYRAAVENNMAIMAYHYVTPDKSWQTHANTMSQLLADYPALYAWMDAEESRGLGKTALESWYYKYLYSGLAPKIGYRAGIYTSPGFWNSYLPRTNWAKLHKLWDANWTLAPEPILPYDWVNINNPKSYTLWQWTAKGPGKEYGVSSTYIDLNRYNGTAAQFNDEFKASVTPPVPPEKLSFEVLWWKLNVRTGPSKSYADIGDLFAGNIVSAQSVGGRNSWIEFEPGKWCANQINDTKYLTQLVGLNYEVNYGILNIRTGPGLEYPDIGDLYRGQQLKVLNVGGADSWIEFEPGKWCAARLGNEVYLRKV